MRLIDADAQYDRLADELTWLMQYGDDVYLAVAEAIRKEPTAYDIGKVVEELETDSSVKLYGSQNSDNYMIPVKRAIEIVKKGIRKDMS